MEWEYDVITKVAASPSPSDAAIKSMTPEKTAASVVSTTAAVESGSSVPMPNMETSCPTSVSQSSFSFADPVAKHTSTGTASNAGNTEGVQTPFASCAPIMHTAKDIEYFHMGEVDKTISQREPDTSATKTESGRG